MGKYTSIKFGIADECWAFILGYLADHKFMPTLQEIADYFNQRNETKHSRQWAKLVLEELEKQGRIRVLPNVPRGIVIINQQKDEQS